MDSTEIKFPFMKGGGEMGALVRNHDWAATQLGSPENWPHALRTTVSLLLNSRFPMFVWWGPDLIMIYNDSYRIIAGDKHPRLLGQSGREGWSEIWKDLQPLVDDVFKGNSTWSEDLPLTINRTGKFEEAFFTFSYSPVLDDDGQVKGLFCAVIETTERVLAKRRIEENEALFRTMVEQAPTAICLTAGEDMVLEVINQPMLEMIDRTKDVLHKPLLVAMPELKDQPIIPILKNIMETGRAFQGTEIPVSVRINGEISLRFYDISYTPVFNNGKVESIIHLAIDVTQQVNLRKSITESEQRFQNLVRDASVGIVLVTGQEKMVSVVNDAYADFVHMKRENLLNKPLFDSIPHARKIFEPVIDEVRNSGRTLKVFDEPFHLDTGEKILEGYFNAIYQPYRETDGRIAGVIIMIQEVSEQVKAREQIFEADERARLAIDAAELGTVEINLLTDELIVSERLKVLFDIDEDNAGRDKYVAAIHPEQGIRKQAYIRAFETGALDFEVRLKRKDASIRWVHVKGKVFFDEALTPVRIVSVIQDITKEKDFAIQLRKQVEDRTRELKRSNEELQQFAHVASHDLKEPVRKIRIFGNRLSGEFANDLPEKAKFYLQRIESAGDRIFKMIEGVLHYSSVEAMDQTTEQVDLNLVISQIREDLEVQIEQKNASFEFTKLPVIEGSNVLMHQMFYNLINNSLKFSTPSRDPVIGIDCSSTEVNNQPFYKILVTDNGIGFNQENAENIFGTFNRLNSKDEYEGTGLGLSLCKKIAERHGGSITAQGIEGDGAVFTVLLPAQHSIEYK